MNNELWHADILVTDEIVNRCLQDQFPELMPIEKLKCIGEGWDNKVFLLNEKIIFRFPRRKIAVELIERESSVLKNLPDFPDLIIPRPKYMGHPTTAYPFPFQGYNKIPGVEAGHARLSDQERIASLPILAAFLKQLHYINEKQALIIGAKPQIFDRTEMDSTINNLHERVDKIIANKICKINKECLQQEITIARKIKLLNDDRCLVHGDLYYRHLLFDSGRLTGIIDWGDTGINDKSVDLAVIWEFYPSTCHQQFFDIYGEVNLATWQYARFLGIYGMLTVMLYANDIGDNLLLAEAINSVKRINPVLLL
jgi:aminoglycoside phosphotransferase (APT) family kinase protein